MQSESTVFSLVVRVEFNHCVIRGNHNCQIVIEIIAVSANQNVALMVNAQIVPPTRKLNVQSCLSSK